MYKAQIQRYQKSHILNNDTRVIFGHTFDLVRMQQAFSISVITDTSNLDVVVDSHHGDVEGADVPESFPRIIQNSDSSLHGVLSRRSNAFPLAAITFGPMQVYSTFLLDSVMPVERAFSHRQLFLYDISDICTVRNVYTIQQGLMEYGFGMRLASMFLTQFWTEYFLAQIWKR
ncbi:uncharacterized protein EV154DRAFT_487734 [Mucor mucedo]|uniref:uncharacterized protein n=1 Tax=Mucor mucedo TaxID=29922 RepID=UPI00221F4CFF|nr:uncharacterized protein EV154DRAFT_487734 [Mucor mucedo]KAI7870891.1 hypothetical protein EV154DRAFT_487734 [Mucor mucedo]